jgi:2'-5' RNA ligase
MMLAVVGYPDLDADDRHRIESFRALHDPQAARLSVHFTFVFPLEAALADLEAEVARVADSAPPITFAIRRAEVVTDASGRGSHVFLVPDEGETGIAALHRRLYAGALQAHLRPDIAYIPHMTVATVPDAADAGRVAAGLDLRERVLRGTLGALDIVDLSAHRVHSLSTCPLRGE